MWSTRGLALVGLVAPLVLGAIKVERGNIKESKDKYEMRKAFFEEGSKFTFVNDFDVRANQTDLSIEELYLFASSGFNWLVENEKRENFQSAHDACILSALWIPEDRKVYMATKAKGKFWEIMAGMEETGFNQRQRNVWAPVWASRAVASESNRLITNRIYHAEDTVYFFFERQRYFRKKPLWTLPTNEQGQETYALRNANTDPQRARDVKYPQGAKVVTWGYYSNSSPDVKKKGKPIPACGPGNDNLFGRQSCQTVADDLGIQWALLLDQPQSEIDANNAMEIPEGPASDVRGCVSNDPGKNPPARKRYEARQDSCFAAPEPIEAVVIDHLPRPAVSDGSCEDDSHCSPTMCAGGGPGGGGAVTCKDNKCTCDAADPPPDNPCESNKDCEDLECDDGMERVCIEDECQCKEHKGQESPTPTPPPKVPECFMQNALPDQYTSPFCKCNLGDETKTVPLLTVEDPKVDTESCHYKTMPTGTENPVTEVTVTYTIDCEVCAGVGGIQNHDPDWCEPIEGCVPPRPTYALYISDTSLSLGTAFNEDEGVEIGQTLVDKLRDACPDDEDTCNTASFEVTDVPLIIDEGVEYMILEANVDDSYYNSTSSRDYMIYGAVSGMVEGTRDSCEEVTYEDSADMGESGCGDGPIPEKRDPPPPEVYWDEETGERQLRKRIPPTDPDGTVDDMMCTYSTNMCSGPKVITAILGTHEDPYLNNLGIRFALKKKDTGIDNPIGQFFCEAIVNALALAAMKYAPKLTGFEGVGAIEDMALETICGSD